MFCHVILPNNMFFIMARCHCKNPEKPVSVTDYFRKRGGLWEYVRSYCRRLPS